MVTIQVEKYMFYCFYFDFFNDFIKKTKKLKIKAKNHIFF